VQQGVPRRQVAHDAASHTPEPASPEELPLEEPPDELPLEDEPLEDPLDELPLEDEPLEDPLDELPLEELPPDELPLEDEPLEEPPDELPLEDPPEELPGVSAAVKQAECSLQGSDRHSARASMVTSLYTFSVSVQSLIMSTAQEEASSSVQSVVTAAVGVMLVSTLVSQVSRAESEPPSVEATSAHVVSDSHVVRPAA